MGISQFELNRTLQLIVLIGTSGALLLGCQAIPVPLDANGTSQSPPPIQSKAPLPDESETLRAEGLIREKKYREAEIVLTREAQRRKNDFAIQVKLILTHKKMAAGYLSKGDFQATADEWDAAHVALIKMKTIVLNTDVTLPDNYESAIKLEEDEIAAGRKQLTIAADHQCEKLLYDADILRREAHRLIRKNDRDKVTAGLRIVRKCVELNSWTSTDTKGKSVNAIRQLVGLVRDDERAAILGAAGLDLGAGRP